jgi:hypothetical protein
MIVQGVLGALGGLVILVVSLVIADIRAIIFGLVLVVPSVFVIYWFLSPDHSRGRRR